MSRTAPEQKTWQEQLAAVSEEIGVTAQASSVPHPADPARPAQGYTIKPMQELPLALSLPDAARLCGLSRDAAYFLVHHDWQPFVKHFGNRGLLIRTRPLLEWLGEAS